MGKFKRAKKGVKVSKTPSVSKTPAELIATAEQFLEEFQPEQARDALALALQLDGNNTQAMDLLGEVLSDLGDVAQAEAVLRASVERVPDQGYSKYMYLGQLCQFPESVVFFEKGIDLLNRAKAEAIAAGSVLDVVTISNKLCSAYCSLAEIFMSDACFEPDAETRCERYAQAALTNSNNFEAHCTMANLRLSQQRPSEAGQHLKAAMGMLKLDEEDAPQPDSEEFVPFEIRMSLVKMLIECSEHSSARDLVDALLREDDECSELWFLGGVASISQGFKSDAIECLEQALTLARKQCLDPAILDSITNHMQKANALTDQTTEANQEQGEDEEGDATMGD